MKGKQLTKMFTVAATTMIFSMSFSVMAMAEEPSLVEKYDVDAIVDTIIDTCMSQSDWDAGDTISVDLSDYHIIEDPYYDDFFDYYYTMVPEYYFFKGGSISWDGTYIISMNFTYSYDKETTLEMMDKFDAVLEDFDAGVDTGWSDLEKALYINNYLLINNTYDDDTLHGYGNRYYAYDALVDHLSVCDGYARAFVLLGERVGLKAYRVSSNGMAHAWNYVKIGNDWYNLDSTWNDNWYDGGSVAYNYFLKSTSYFQNPPRGSAHEYTDWTIEGMDRTTGLPNMSTCTSTAFDSIDLDSAYDLLIPVGDYWYAVLDGSVIRYDLSNNEFDATTEYTFSGDTWDVPSGGYYPGSFYHSVYYNDCFYISGSKKIYKYDPKTQTATTFYTLNDTELATGRIYNLSVTSNGLLTYSLKEGPNSYEPVLATGTLCLSREAHEANAYGICKRCGQMVDGATSLLGVSCDVNDYIGLNFALAVTDTAKADFLNNDAYITITQYTGDDTTATPFAVFDNISFADLTYDSNTKSFTVPCKVSAKEMSDTLVLTINNGTNTYTEYTYSVQDYLETLKDDSTYGDFVNQLLKYGAFAQLYFKYNTSDLAATVSSYTNISEVTDAIADGGLHKSISCSDPDVSFYGWTLILKSQITIRAYFTVAEDSYYADKISHASGNLCYIDSTNAFSPLYYSNNYTIDFGGCTASYSVYDYIYNMVQKDSCSTELKDLLVSMYYLSEEAKQL